MVRPEHCRLIGCDGSDECPGWPGRVTAMHYLGCDEIVDVTVGAGQSVRVRQRAGTSIPISPGSSVAVVVSPEALWPIPERDPAWLSLAGKDADARP